MCRLLGAFSGLRASVLASRALLAMCVLFSFSTDHVTILQLSGCWALFWLVTAGRLLFGDWSVRGSGDMPHRLSVLKWVEGTQCCITQAMPGLRVLSWVPQKPSPTLSQTRPSSTRGCGNTPHYYRNIDFAVSAVNGAPGMRGCPGGKITSIGDL